MTYISIKFNIYTYLSLSIYSVPDAVLSTGNTEMKQVWSLLSKTLTFWEEKYRQMAVDTEIVLQEVVCSGLKRKRSVHFRKP